MKKINLLKFPILLGKVPDKKFFDMVNICNDVNVVIFTRNVPLNSFPSKLITVTDDSNEKDTGNFP